VQAAFAAPQEQAPPVQVSRSQQSPVALQATPRSLHAAQAVPTQRKPSQQSPETWHASPPRVHCRAHVPAAPHPNPEQQVPAPHEAPARPQPGRQTCVVTPFALSVTHARRAQHSPLVEQASPSRLQRGAPQRPASQPAEQQSPTLAQGSPSGRHPGLQTPPLQTPEQQVPSLSQAPPGNEHRQTPSPHRPEQHAPAAVQAVPAGAQVAGEALLLAHPPTTIAAARRQGAIQRATLVRAGAAAAFAR